jgi:hypothetical protein
MQEKKSAVIKVLIMDSDSIRSDSGEQDIVGLKIAVYDAGGVCSGIQ